ncbi:CBS domain-containing protein [Candidatus Woesearchaeota archaeon]|nr:CBS domain-containing protein [Candidatus Woesearchaeota archaeon]
MFDISRLKDIRKRLNLTQYAFAKQAGVSQSLIAKIESGRIDPSYSNVKRIEDAVSLLSSQKEPSAKEIMTKRVINVTVSVPAPEVIAVMKKHQISQVPVVDNAHVLGLVSEASILEHDVSRLKHLRARDVMTDPPPVVSEQTRLSVISALLRQFPLVVIRKDHELVGVVTKADVLRILV